LNNGTIYYVWVKQKNANDTGGVSTRVSGMPMEYMLGDTGPGGGKIFYVSEEGFILYMGKDDIAGVTAHYLEAAPADIPGGKLTWGSNSITNTATGIDIGWGLKNTAIILDRDPSAPAAKACDEYSNNGMDDWFLPSLAELQQLSLQRNLFPNTWDFSSGTNGADGHYWSSSAYSSSSIAWCRKINIDETGSKDWKLKDTAMPVRAIRAFCGVSTPVNVKPIGDMGAVTLTAGNGQLTASWAAVTGVDQYEVYYSVSTTMPRSPAQTVSTTNVTITGLTNGTTYYVWVKPKNANGTGAVSTRMNAKPIGNVNAINANQSSYTSFYISWSAVPGADQYEIHRANSQSQINDRSRIGIVSTTSATISDLTAWSVYFIAVRPINAYGAGEYKIIMVMPES
jgi:hypothetical protein